MTVLMATEPKPVRLVVQTDEDLRAALKLEAAKRGLDMSEVADAILREQLADSLAVIQARRQAEEKKPKGGK